MANSDTKLDDKKEIERFLVSVFSKIQDRNGQSLDITLALPTLITIISGGSQQTSEKQAYDFLGPAACQLAVRVIVANEFSELSSYQYLEPVAEEFNSFKRMNSLIWKEMNLELIKPVLPHDIIQTIAGVLLSFVGLSAVETFIDSAVIQIAALKLCEIVKNKICSEVQ
ncbi:hypothetical protein BD770DRAFT_394558 [Pilaira anomala]|nr:hypothetical protein BD770DRAFT_394558 [Pilaira anomala]